MSESLSIRSYRHEYTAAFVSDFAATLGEVLRPGDYLILDRNVCDLHPRLAQCVEGFRQIAIEPNEATKSYQGLAPIIQELIENRFSKSNRLVAVGGGIVQDVTAFTASVLFRGVDWLFFPTSLLAQCDSCIGSKTSINFGAYKNQLGGFFPPKAVYIDSAFLSTLSPREIRSGLGEMMHYFLVSGEADFEWAAANVELALSEASVMRQMIERSLAIKKDMIERDEFDRGPRNVFNYGHSFGHALETTTHYAVPHGIAVSYGMDLANLISSRQGLVPMSLRNRIRPALSKVWQGTELGAIDSRALCAALTHDKKNEGTEIKVILTKGIGQMFKTTLVMSPEVVGLIQSFFDESLYGKDL